MDYGAPVGSRLSLKHPERVSARIVQNGNTYDEGLKESSARVTHGRHGPACAIASTTGEDGRRILSPSYADTAIRSPIAFAASIKNVRESLAIDLPVSP
jgi:pimeloyl-ACP methyl ester carboxylesterase